MAGYVLTRWNGLGDLAMLLCAAQAIKRATGKVIIVRTSPQYVTLAEACPFVDAVVTSETVDPKYKAIDLGSAIHGITPTHEVDSFTNAVCSLNAPASNKSLILNIPNAQIHPAKRSSRRVLLCPAQGDPNRTLPIATWNFIASTLISLGYHVGVVGTKGTDKASPDISVDEVVDYRDTTILQMVSLLQKSALLVACDTGSIQLAGASDIGIVGVYSVVNGSSRLPFRHGQLGWNATAVEPKCTSFPCYHKMMDPVFWTPAQQAIDAGKITFGDVFVRWCPANTNYSCMCDRGGEVVEACLKHLEG